MSNWNRRAVIGFGGASLTAMIAAQAAFGQSAQPANEPAASSGLEEIVVTATRRSELLKNVPMAVDAISAAELTKKEIFDFKDIDQLAPGLVLQNSDGRSNTATLRGIAFNPDSGTSPTVNVYFNEIEADAQTVFTAIYDIDQIEVLRGPQGLLRGRTSPAGSITLKTKQPSLNTYEGYVQATGTDQDAYNFQGAVSIPIVNDILAIRIAGLGDQNEINHVHNTTTGVSSIGHTESGRLSVNFAPTDDFRSVLTYQYLYADNVQQQQVIGTGVLLPTAAGFPSSAPLALNGPVAGASDRIAVSPGVNEFWNRTHFLTLDANWDIGQDTLAINAGYQDTLLTQYHGLNSGNAPTTYIDQQIVHTPYSVTSFEIRYFSSGREFWNYSIGADFARQLNPVSVTQPSDSFISAAQLSPTFTFPFAPHYIDTPVDVAIFIPDQVTRYSFFGSSSFQLTDDLKLDAGLRYQINRIHQQSNLSVFVGGAAVVSDLPTINSPNDIRTDHAFTGGVDLTYKITPDHVAYVSYGHTFRDGVAAVGVTAPLANNLIVTQPETSDSVEAGLKSSWFEHRLNVTGDVFYQHFNGYIQRTADQINTSAGANGIISSVFAYNFNADATSEGIETQVDAVVIPGWDVGMKASWVNAQFNDALIPCNQFTASGAAVVPIGQQVAYCLTNGRLSETSKFHLTLSSEYSYDIGSYEPFISALFTYAPGWHSSVVNYDFGDLPNLNLYAGVRNDEQGWELTLFAKNLFDTVRITGISEQQYQQGTSTVQTFNGNALVAGAPIFSGYRTLNVTNPREFGVTLRYRFGG